MAEFIRIKDTIIPIEEIEEITFYDSDGVVGLGISEIRIDKYSNNTISFLYNLKEAKEEFNRIEKILCGEGKNESDRTNNCQ